MNRQFTEAGKQMLTNIWKLSTLPMIKEIQVKTNIGHFFACEIRASSIGDCSQYYWVCTNFPTLCVEA